MLAKDVNLAELTGIILGDGNLGFYPRYPKKEALKIRCHYLRIYCCLDEKQYAKEIELILKLVFKKQCYIYERPLENVLYLEISLKSLDTLLGLPIGDKIKNKVEIPKWIFNDKKYLLSCLRGLFDTDGCCYLTNKKYRIVNFTSANSALLKNIRRGLLLLGFHPYNKGNKYIEIGRQSEVTMFFDKIKPRNRKHYRYAGVANLVTARV